MKILILLAVMMTSLSASAQRLHLNLSAGLANYQGDLNEKRFSLKQSRLAFGVGLGYEISDRFSLRGHITAGKIGADDKSGKNVARNLNFESSLIEGHAAVEYFIKDPYSHQVAPYIFAGVAVFHYNPYTNDSAGKKVYLKPLSTEGQGFVSGRNAYNLTQFAIPFGGGLKFPINENLRLGIELGFRKTFTDYVDDVSTSYVDRGLLLINRGQLAVDLAYRSDEIKQSTYPTAGVGRGGPKYKDWYYFTAFTASFRLGGGTGGGRSKRGVGCPGAVN